MKFCMNIKNRILLCVIILQLAGFSAMLLHYNKRATNAVYQFNRGQISNTLTATIRQLDATASQLERTAIGLARNGEHFHDNHHYQSEDQVRADLQRLLLRTFNTFAEAEGAGIWYEPAGLFPDKVSVAPYIYHEGGQTRFTWELSDGHFPYHNRSWYQQVIPASWPRTERPPQELYWSLQDADEFPGHETVMTVATPMFDDRQTLIGIATVNWAVSRILPSFTHLNFTPGTRVSLYYQPQHRFLNDAWALRPALMDSVSSDQAEEIKGLPGFHLFTARSASGLVLAVQIPVKDLAEVVTGTLAGGLTIHAGIAVLFLTIMTLVLGILFRPFEQILERLRNAVSLNQSAERPKFNPIQYDGQTEFTPIVQAFNTLIGQVTDFADQLSNTNSLLQDEQRRVAELNATLESKVDARTRELEAKNREVVESLQLLKLTQKQLLTLEKHAALGEVVAGLAHEINTPLGISVTAVSALEDQLSDLEDQFRSGRLSKDAFADYVGFAREGLEIAADNLRRAADLIARFKQVAVDQASEQKRDFELCDYVRSILFSLRPSYKYRPLDVTVECDHSIIMSGYPGAVAQIITNLLMNALTHAFPPEQDDVQQRGSIRIHLSEANGEICLRFRDSGAGMAEETRQQLFAPFFTTRRASGGSGLGASIILDLVTHQLHGRISVTSTLGEGTEFVICFPPSFREGND